MSLAYDYCDEDFGERAKQISIEALEEVGELRERFNAEGISFVNQILEILSIRSEMLAFSINASIIVNNPVFTPALEHLRRLTRVVEDDILNSPIIENVPMTIVKRLRTANMNLIDAILQLDLAANREIEQLFADRGMND